MGEYLSVRGATLCKLGTCDDFRYTRRDEGLRLVLSEDRGVDPGALSSALEDPRTLWRFPFPWEDFAGEGTPTTEDDVSAINGRDMFSTLVVNVSPETLAGIQHGTRVVSMSPSGIRGAYNVNVWIPCPYSEAGAKLQRSPVPNILTIYGERHDPATGTRTIFRCGYCDAPASFTPDEIAGFDCEPSVRARLRGRVA